VHGLLFIALAAFGWLCLWGMKHTGAWGDAILGRAAALLMLAAGYAGAGGLVGKFLNWLTSGFLHLVGSFGAELVGASIVAVVGLAGVILGILWVVGFLPHKVFKWGLPNWLIWGGLVLPLVLRLGSGPLAQVVNAILSAAGLGALHIADGVV
jgi:hypothetical protein